MGQRVWRSQHGADGGWEKSSHLDQVHRLRPGDQLDAGCEFQHVRFSHAAAHAQLGRPSDDQLLMLTFNSETTHMRYIDFFRTGRVSPIRLASLTVLATAVACNSDKILQVTDPDVARPAALQGAAALPTLRAGAVGNFGVAYNGGASDVEQVHLSGLVSDEFINTETFPTRIEIDQRAMTLSNVSLVGTFFDLTRARASSELAIRTYKESATKTSDSTGFPEILSLNGLAYILFAENYCGAVPVSFQAADGSFTFGAPESTNILLDSAIARL